MQKFNAELLDLLIKRINKLCFEECQVDRISCTLSPMCSRRFLLKLRILNNLKREDLPLDCYDIHKKNIMRDFLNKTVTYRPIDAYLYLIDFLDIYFHGDYRKLNKFISFKNWEEALEIFDDRRENRSENFDYILTDHYMIFNYEDKIHIIFIEETYVICNALRDPIPSLELLKGLCDLYAKPFFPQIQVTLTSKNSIELSLVIPSKVILTTEEIKFFELGEIGLKNYFWNDFAHEIEELSDICNSIHLSFDRMTNLEIKLYLNLETNVFQGPNYPNPLRYRDLRTLFNFFNHIIEEF